MRNFIVSSICLMAVIAIWACFTVYASSNTDYFEESLDTLIYEYVNEEKWDHARTHFDDLQNDWNDYKRVASFFLDAGSINHIDSTFKKVYFYISADDKSNSSGELAYLKGLFTALNRNEALTLENIF